MQAYFDQLDRVRYEGSKSSNPLAFRHYNPDELVLGKRMEEHLRFCRLLLAHILLERGGHVWCGGV
ncbi:D-xylose isomerase [Escherichia coli]|uniref:D-xylose isomerase n=1 Tax=Escherichia coli TaxID=562 RepID=A0A2X3LL28_ECOLX|nr:D-xylose isomerase [Escherichia coli]